jgi:3-deoxy-D-manno-octulosonate 8-phosphate phosphatase (KDO 8-P phosphatase)
MDITLEEIAFVGDDLPDLAVLLRVGLGITPANGNHILVSQALWQTKKSGGNGAVREVAELILTVQGKMEALLATYQ